MTRSLPNPRFERKFIAEGFSLPEALSLVRRNRGAFREAYPPRLVNNIYLDSPSRAAYYDHINGAPNRVKHRIRWYGAPHGDVPHPVLELKFKSGSVSGKDSHDLAPFQLNGQPVSRSVGPVLSSSTLPERLRAGLLHLSPCLVNQYWRHYFISRDGQVRLTVDSDFRFAATQLPHTKLLMGFSGVPAVVLEVKYRLEDASLAEAITDSLPLRMTRCSKFILGVERV